MTGFGKAETTIRGDRITAEIRTLNSKQLDLSLRLPQAYRSLEQELRNLIARTVSRGKVDFTISVEKSAASSPVRINKELFNEYYKQIKEARSSSDMSFIPLGMENAILIPAILRLPDVVTSEAHEISEEEKEAILSTASAAIDHLNEFRAQEGATLIADLLARVEIIERLRDQVTPYEQARTETIRTRILESLEKLRVEIDRNRFEQEMIFYLEKLDITEEKVRLTNHCRYFRETAANEEEVGRKLGFIAQEMGREINTLGSKANESHIQRLVVEMKDELEKIKEQVLNLL